VSDKRNHEKMAEMVRLITVKGPKIDEISRRIGVYNETVRYWYNNLLERGMVIQGSCNYERLGMRRIVAIVELGDLIQDYADTFFSAMGELCYVVGFAKVKGHPFHIMNVSMPQECLGEWTDFMVELKRLGIFKSVETMMLDWFRNVPMKAEHFDFESGKWNSEWNLKKGDSATPEPKPDGKEMYDNTDLRIIEQLQINASSSLTEMCHKVGAKNYKTFSWHYREHVLGRNLIKGYRMNWTGMKFGSESNPGEERRSGYAWMDVLGTNLSADERSVVRNTLTETPFVWMEGSGTRSHYSRMALPIEQADAIRGSLEKALKCITNRMRWFYLDQAHALSFSLPNHLYDEGERNWSFKKDETVQRFETLQRVRHEIVYGHFPSGRRSSTSYGD